MKKTIFFFETKKISSSKLNGTLVINQTTFYEKNRWSGFIDISYDMIYWKLDSGFVLLTKCLGVTILKNKYLAVQYRHSTYL